MTSVGTGPATAPARQGPDQSRAISQHERAYPSTDCSRDHRTGHWAMRCDHPCTADLWETCVQAHRAAERCDGASDGEPIEN